MADDRYPEETLGDNDDNGTMPESLEELSKAVVGHRIISATTEKTPEYPGSSYITDSLVLTLDNGKRVILNETNDCCAYTSVDKFFLDPAAVDHTVMGVGTTGSYTTWHIYADFGDIMKLEVGWSCGNPFYYGYGFNIAVEEIEEQ